MRSPQLSTLLALCCLTGCSPLGTTTARTTSSKLSEAQATHEYPSPAPAPERATAPHSTPEQAVRAFADEYINWSAPTVTAQMRALAAASVGQARSAMELEAAQTAGDYELQRGGVANHGVVEAVAPLLGGDGRYAVVTRESTTATFTTEYQGLRPAWHVAIATISRSPTGGWVVSGWQPES